MGKVLQFPKKITSRVSKKERNDIVMEYTPLVRFVAKKIASRLPANMEIDDLISCGMLGLIDAVEKFDPERAVLFKTYAEHRIRGAILDELRAQDWVPRSVREMIKMVDSTSKKLEANLGRRASTVEMCDELKMELDEFYRLMNNIKPVKVLNINELTDTTVNRLYEKTVNNDFLDIDPLAMMTGKSGKKRIQNEIANLPERERTILLLYYFEQVNLREIGEILDLSESRVSQLHNLAKSKLKLCLSENLLCA